MNNCFKGKFVGWKIWLLGAVACLVMSLLMFPLQGLARMFIYFLLFPVSLILFGMELKNNKLLRYPEIKILTCMPVLFFLVCVLHIGSVKPMDNLSIFVSIVPLFFLCFPLAYALPKDKASLAIRILAWIWLGVIFVFAALGIFVAAKEPVHFRGYTFHLGLRDHRLYMFYNPNGMGVHCSMAILTGLLLLLSEKTHRWAKPVAAVMTLVCLITLTLTNSRSGKYGLLPGIFLFGVILSDNLFRTRQKKKRVGVAILSGIVACVLFLGLYKITDRVFYNIAENHGMAFAYEDNVDQMTDQSGSVHLEEAKENSVWQEERRERWTSSGRGKIWRKAIENIKNDPSLILKGTTPAFVYEVNPGYDLHNGYFSVLVGYGLIPFMAFLAFLVLLIIAVCKLTFCPSATMEKEIRYMPAFVLAVLVYALVETFFFTMDSFSGMDIWFAIASGFVFVFSKDIEIKTKKERLQDGLS